MQRYELKLQYTQLKAEYDTWTQRRNEAANEAEMMFCTEQRQIISDKIQAILAVYQ